jgi:hypothetical protein
MIQRNAMSALRKRESCGFTTSCRMTVHHRDALEDSESHQGTTLLEVGISRRRYEETEHSTVTWWLLRELSS